VDGKLDDPVYSTTPPFSGFIQAEPSPNAAATERTEVWITYDTANIYVSVRAWESQPDKMIVNELRRDSNNIIQNENFGFMFDTNFDRRNGVIFTMNPLGGRMDGELANESRYNGDWNPVWRLAVGRFEGGWTAEAAIPFKSLRYQPGRMQTWGFNARRTNRWKNETSYLTPLSSGVGNLGLQRASQAATMVGLEVPSGSASRTLEIKPYVIGDVTRDAAATPPKSDKLGGDFGLDAKVGLTRSLTADFTYNTDFAQVEADEQQINLTRFSLFFPEKREFFLENQGLFQFGGAQGRGSVPFLFYSRRIGLNSGRPVPIQAGGRVAGQIGAFSVGVIDIRTEADPVSGADATNFSVLRVQRNILRRSSVGAMFTGRSASTTASGSNQAYGLDGRFAFYQNLALETYWAQTRTGGKSGDDTSYRAQLNYNADRYGLNLSRLVVGKNFNPEVGFIFRNDISKYFTQVRFSPRPASIKIVRKFSWQGHVDYVENGAGQTETRDLEGQFNVDFANSDTVNLTYLDSYQQLDKPFEIASGVIIPVDAYRFGSLNASYTMGQQRPTSGTAFIEHGAFWGGDRTTIGYRQARLKISPQVAIEPGVSVNRVSLPFGSFTTSLISSRITYAATPLMFVSGLVQYNSSSRSVDSNVRLRWEYLPGSELFIVYNETRDTDRSGFPFLEGRSLVVKITRFLRF
jgi:hypothetical protein